MTNLTPTPRRYLAYVGAFSRMSTLKQVYLLLFNKLRIRFEDMRLWLFRDEVMYKLRIFVVYFYNLTIFFTISTKKLF